MARKAPSTRAVHVLRDAGIGYTEHLFNYKRHPTAIAAADALGVDPAATVKTIVFTSDVGDGVVVLMHGDREVSTKKLARVMDVKTVRPSTQREANRFTGYQFGGTSPLGMRSNLEVYAQETIANIDTVYVNGGSRGFLLGISAASLLSVTTATLADLTVD